MSNDDVLDLVEQCDIHKGKMLAPGEAYLFKQMFRTFVSGREKLHEEEIIVLVWRGTKVGGIYRMGSENVHWVINEKYREKHLLSSFLKKGILERIWPENESVTLCGIYFRDDYEKKKYLASLCHMSIRNEAEIERKIANMERHRQDCINRVPFP